MWTVFGSWLRSTQLSTTLPPGRLTTSIRTSVGSLLVNMYFTRGFFRP